MRPDPEIDEIRATRRRISERHGHDLKNLFKHYQDLERQLQDSANKHLTPEMPKEKAGTGKP